MGKAAEFYNGLNDAIANAVNRVRPFRAKATSVANGMVQIQEYGSDSPLAEPYARLAGSAINVNDEVAVIMLGDKPFVLGRIQRTAEAAASSEAFGVPVYVDTTNDIAFAVRDNAGLRSFRVDTNGTKYIYVENDTIITGHRASDGAQRYWIKSADGAASFVGNVNVGSLSTSGSISAGSVTGTGFNSPIMHTVNDGSSATPSTTAVTTWVDQGTFTWALPTGTWTVYVTSLGRIAHTVDKTCYYRVAINTSLGGSIGGTAPIEGSSFGASHGLGGCTGTITIKSQAYSSAAGTMYTGGSTFLCVARRTS